MLQRHIFLSALRRFTLFSKSDFGPKMSYVMSHEKFHEMSHEMFYEIVNEMSHEMSHIKAYEMS